MNLIDRLHAFTTDRLGVSPKVADPFFAGLAGLVVASLVQWATTGELAFDLVQLKILGVVFVLGVLGYAAPIARAKTGTEIEMKTLHKVRPRASSPKIQRHE